MEEERERSGVKERRLDADAVTCLSSWNCLLVSDAPAAARYDGDSYWPHKYMGIKALRVLVYRHYRLLPTKRLPAACCYVQVLSWGLLPAPHSSPGPGYPPRGRDLLYLTKQHLGGLQPLWSLCNSAADQGKPTVEAEQPSGEGGGKTGTDHTRSHPMSRTTLGPAAAGEKEEPFLSLQDLSLSLMSLTVLGR